MPLTNEEKVEIILFTGISLNNKSHLGNLPSQKM